MNSQIEILLIEDNPNDIELTLRAFKKNKLENSIKVIDDGADALKFLFPEETDNDDRLQFLPKLILLDLKLPRVGGLEILRRLKSDKQTKIIPVVVMTSSEQEQDVIESYSLGVNSYIVKPINFQKFVESVETIGLYWMLLNKPVG